MPDNYAPVPVKRIAQIISHRHSNSDASPAASAVEMARRIHLEMIYPEQQRAAEAQERVTTLIKMNAELTLRLDNLLMENAKLVAENNRLAVVLREIGEGQ
jgi:hypothetical protein